MDTFNEDPKPGRLVLPLVLIGMIATTYTFINRVASNNDLEMSSFFSSNNIFLAFGFGVSINSIIKIYFNINIINI